MSQVTGEVVWLPADLHEQLKIQAGWNGHTVSDEIVRQLKLPRGGIGRWVDTPKSVQQMLDESAFLKPPAMTNGDPSKFTSGCLCGGGVAGLSMAGTQLLEKGEAVIPLSEFKQFMGRLERKPQPASITGYWTPPSIKPLEGQVWVLTGSLVSMSRDTAREHLMGLGATVAGAITARTTVLVVGPDASPNKIHKAKLIGTHQWTETEFLNLLRDLGVDIK